MAPGPVAEGSRWKNFCCVTTRRCNVRFPERLWRRSGSLTAHSLCLGVLCFGGLVTATFGLSACRQPAPDQLQAFGVLAVTLIPTPGRVLASTAFAQANPWSRPAAAVWLMMMTAHGSCVPKGQPGENVSAFSSGAWQNREADGR